MSHGSMALRTAALTILLTVGCRAEPATPPPSGDGAITVASFDFAESRLLAELYSQALEAGGYPVRRVFDLGAREFVAPPWPSVWWTSSPSTPAPRSSS